MKSFTVAQAKEIESVLTVLTVLSGDLAATSDVDEIVCIAGTLLEIATDLATMIGYIVPDDKVERPTPPLSITGHSDLPF